MPIKHLTAETAAKHVTEAMQPVADFNAAANVKQPVPPVKTPLPAPLEAALGINQQRKVPKS
jgi:hypothetical protein